MILFIVVIVPIMIYLSWLFFKKSPGGKRVYIFTYNSVTFLLVSLLSSYLGYDAYRDVMSTVDSGRAPFIAFAYTTISFSAGIIVVFLLRNFLLFGNRK